MNFQKSDVFYSPTFAKQKEELSAILHISNDLHDSKYLGLPSFVGRSKKRVFGFVKDKVQKSIQGWKTKHILRVG